MTFPVKDWEREFSCFASLLLCLFAELFLYLRQYKTPHPWQAVIIYPRRNHGVYLLQAVRVPQIVNSVLFLYSV
ncbi:MAG: DUF2887 domain-containing protein [Microcystis panniformis]